MGELGALCVSLRGARLESANGSVGVGVSVEGTGEDVGEAVDFFGEASGFPNRYCRGERSESR